jgi:hypothetical protein
MLADCKKNGFKMPAWKEANNILKLTFLDVIHAKNEDTNEGTNEGTNLDIARYKRECKGCLSSAKRNNKFKNLIYLIFVTTNICKSRLKNGLY